MANVLLSAKLAQLDEQLARLHSRIALSQTTDAQALDDTIRALERACEEESLMFSDSLRRSKARTCTALLEGYEKLCTVAKETNDRLHADAAAREDTFLKDQQLLLAEYELDFALLAAHKALLTALRAIRMENDETDHIEEA